MPLSLQRGGPLRPRHLPRREPRASSSRSTASTTCTSPATSRASRSSRSTSATRSCSRAERSRELRELARGGERRGRAARLALPARFALDGPTSAARPGRGRGGRAAELEARRCEVDAAGRDALTARSSIEQAQRARPRSAGRRSSGARRGGARGAAQPAPPRRRWSARTRLCRELGWDELRATPTRSCAGSTSSALARADRARSSTRPTTPTRRLVDPQLEAARAAAARRAAPRRPAAVLPRHRARRRRSPAERLPSSVRGDDRRARDRPRARSRTSTSTPRRGATKSPRAFCVAAARPRRGLPRRRPGRRARRLRARCSTRAATPSTTRTSIAGARRSSTATSATTRSPSRSRSCSST